MRPATLIAAGMVLLLGAACAAPAPTPTAVPSPTPTPTPSPAGVAQQAAERMQSLQSLHFTFELSGKPVALDSSGSMVLTRAEGDVVRPDQVRAIVQVSSMGFVSEVGIVGIGSDRFATNPFNQQWEKLPPDQGWFFDPALLFDPQVGISAVLQEAGWSFGEEELIEEQTHHRLQATLPGERISPLASGLIGPGEVRVEIWTGAQDYLVRRIRLLERGSDPQDPTTWLLTFSAFDELKGIKAPKLP